jgi:glucose-1-phosphate cytidylyltransferase
VTQNIPKPLIEIGDRPILWHIMKNYSFHGVTDFIICCGYKGYLIKEYFSNYFLHMSDVTFDMKDNVMHVHNKRAEPWSVTLVDTGEKTMTGGRIKRVKEYIENDDAFCMTYGDGLSDINVTDVINFHNNSNCLATVSAVFPPGRFGALEIKDNIVKSFQEKPIGDAGGRINGGFFVLSPKVIEYIENDQTTWELEPLEKLAFEGQIQAYKHDGFWHPMDTLRDKLYLQKLWESNNPPWKKW